MPIKQLRRWVSRCISLLSLVLMVGMIYLGWTPPTLAAEVQLCAPSEQKIDLNNANLIAFQDCPGFYPTLAKAIVINGPYDSVEDVLAIPDLSKQQKAMLKANLDSFMVSAPVAPLEMKMPPKPPFSK